MLFFVISDTYWSHLVSLLEVLGPYSKRNTISALAADKAFE